MPSRRSQTDWPRVDSIRDEDIDTSDHPEITGEMRQGAVVRVGRKRFIRMVNLGSGLESNSYRADVSDHVVDGMRSLISRLGDEPLLISDTLSVTGTRSPNCLVVRIYYDSALAAEIGIATRQRCGSAIWRQMHDTWRELATESAEQPPVPWCATRLEPACEPVMPQIVDMAQALAWAWVADE